MDYVAKALNWASDSDYNIQYFKMDALTTKNGNSYENKTNYDYLCDNLSDIKKHDEVIKQLSQIFPENWI